VERLIIDAWQRNRDGAWPADAAVEIVAALAARDTDRDALARVENLVMRLIAEAHRRYPDAGVHWVNADDLRAALAPAATEPAGQQP
jgi:hypothetical protein